MVVTTKGTKSEGELNFIAYAYQQYKSRTKPIGRPPNGEWRWCLNPECKNAFYALRFKIDKGQGVCCSQRCVGKIFGAQKGERIGRWLKAEFRPNQLVVNVNLSSSIYERIGRIVGIQGNRIKVDFQEGLGVVRVYTAGVNLHHIKPLVEEKNRLMVQRIIS